MVERNVARAEMYLADEVFLSGTAAELVPVREIDDHTIGTGRPGEITRVLQAAFDDAVHGRSERYREWLDVVQAPALDDPHGRSGRAGSANGLGEPFRCWFLGGRRLGHGSPVSPPSAPTPAG